MVKPEWGTKRTCPKCGTRFYDLGKEDPATCVECGESFVPEAVLKSKQPMPFEAAPKKDAKKEEDAVDDDDLDINIDDDEPSPDNEVDLGGDDDLGVSKGKGDDEPDDT
ncbi:TIGR02300 family protein [Parasphingorhabdus sp.]|uniref:TIGR02300 family protein n=1 Tax=Parasphingorhabdus sp. TaxID=2709688 RepID=UPI003A9324FC